MSGQSAGAKASKTGSENEITDKIEGSKDDFEGGSTTTSPAAKVALQTTNDEGPVPWASLQVDDLKRALLARVEGRSEYEECILESESMLEQVYEAALEGAPLAGLTLPDPVEWLTQQLVKACTNHLTLEQLSEDYNYLESIFKQLVNNKEEALKEHRDANNNNNNTNGDENGVASDTSSEEALHDGNTVRSVKTKTGESVVQKGDGLNLEAMLSANTESTPALDATTASEAKSVATSFTEKLLATPVANAISTATKSGSKSAVPSAKPVQDVEATPMTKQMQDQELLVKPNISEDPAAADEFEVTSEAHEMKGMIIEMKVQIKEMFIEGLGNMEESMESSHEHLRDEVSERITILRPPSNTS